MLPGPELTSFSPLSQPTANNLRPATSRPDEHRLPSTPTPQHYPTLCPVYHWYATPSTTTYSDSNVTSSSPAPCLQPLFLDCNLVSLPAHIQPATIYSRPNPLLEKFDSTDPSLFIPEQTTKHRHHGRDRRPEDLDPVQRFRQHGSW